MLRVAGVVIAGVIALAALAAVMSAPGVLDEAIAHLYAALAGIPHALGIRAFAGYAVAFLLLDLLIAAGVFVSAQAAGSSDSRYFRIMLGVLLVVGLAVIFNVLFEAKVLGAMDYTATPPDAYVFARARALVRDLGSIGPSLSVVAGILGFLVGRRRTRGAARTSSLT